MLCFSTLCILRHFANRGTYEECDECGAFGWAFLLLVIQPLNIFISVFGILISLLLDLFQSLE